MTDLEKIQANWQSVIAAVTAKNRMIGALMRDTQVVSLDGNLITIVVGYEYHYNNLNEEKNRAFVEQVLLDTINARCGLRVVLAQPHAA